MRCLIRSVWDPHVSCFQLPATLRRFTTTPFRKEMKLKSQQDRAHSADLLRIYIIMHPFCMNKSKRSLKKHRLAAYTVGHVWCETYENIMFLMFAPQCVRTVRMVCSHVLLTIRITHHVIWSWQFASYSWKYNNHHIFSCAHGASRKTLGLWCEFRAFYFFPCESTFLRVRTIRTTYYGAH